MHSSSVYVEQAGEMWEKEEKLLNFLFFKCFPEQDSELFQVECDPSAGNVII